MDDFNTLGGRYGFAAELEDGRTLTEAEGTWDDVPSDARIKRLSIRNFVEDRSLASIDGCERYFFSNEGLANWDGRTALTAKVFGGVKEGTAMVVRVRVGDEPRAEHSTVPAASLPFGDSVFRIG